ncbi:MAG: M16 family metallopeptidase [Phycisphaerae bacterium]
MITSLLGCQSGTGSTGISLFGDRSGADGAKVFDLPYLMRDLDNGLRVIVVKTDYPDIVTLQIPVQTGSRNEVEEGKSGFAHFFEHMMFRGTEKYPPEVYSEILKNAGADQNAYTTDDYTNYHTTFTKNDLEKVLEIEADRFQNLKYSEDQFRTEALAVRGEYLKNYSNPIRKLFERLRDIAYREHTYKHTTMGFFRDIEDMPNQMEYSRTFFDRWYRPEYATVIVCGDVEPEKTFNLVKKYWGSWKRGNWNVDIPTEPAPDGPMYDHIQWESPTQPWIVMAFHGPGFDGTDKAMPSLELMAQHYFSENSAIYKKLVIEERKADQIWASFAQRKDPYLLSIGARVTDIAHADYVRESILKTLAQARTEMLEDSDLLGIKSRLRYGFTAGMDNTASIGSIMARYVHFDRDPEMMNRLFATYDQVSPADITKYTNEYFTDQRMVTITLATDETMPNWNNEQSLDAMAAEMGRTVTPANIELVENRGASPLISVAFLFRTGAADDPTGKKGLAALTAAMITDGGSESRPIDELQAAMYPIAAGFGNQVDKEMTRLSGMVHRDNLATWYDVVTDQLLSPGWRQEDLDRIKEQTINRIKTGLVGNNDEELGKELLYESIYGPDHPYGTLTLGAIDDIESITLDDVKGFYKKYFTVENLTLGLAGSYEKSFVNDLRQDLATLPRGKRSNVQLTSASLPAGHEAVIVEKPTPGVAVSFGYPISVKRGDKDWAALWLVRSWLGEHRSTNSHLFQRIREVRGMNYGNYAYIEYFPRGMFQFYPDANLGRQAQIFQVWVRPLRSNNDAHFATRTAIYEIDQLIKNGMSKTDFEASRNYLNKFVSLLTQTQSRQLGYAMDSKFYGTDAFPEYVRRNLKSLTVDDVNRVIRKYLQTDNLQFIFVTRDADDLKQRLISNQSSPLQYNTPKPELAGEDAAIQTLPLRFTDQGVSILKAEEVFR